MNVTNQQLAFARVQAQAGENATSALARRAHWQAGVMQLGLALESYAAELRESAKLKVPVRPGAHMFSGLLEDFKAAGKASAELDELASLERNPASWLSILQQWTQDLLNLGGEGGERHHSSVLAETSLTQSGHAQSKVRGADMIALIDVVEASDNAPAFSESLFQDAIRSATVLIERQRGNSLEY